MNRNLKLNAFIGYYFILHLFDRKNYFLGYEKFMTFIICIYLIEIVLVFIDRLDKTPENVKDYEFVWEKMRKFKSIRHHTINDQCS